RGHSGIAAVPVRPGQLHSDRGGVGATPLGRAAPRLPATELTLRKPETHAAGNGTYGSLSTFGLAFGASDQHSDSASRNRKQLRERGHSGSGRSRGPRKHRTARFRTGPLAVQIAGGRAILGKSGPRHPNAGRRPSYGTRDRPG